jgi:3-oxoadipate enol-lactonase
MRGGPRAVVLYGSLGTTPQMWEAQVPALAERFKVVMCEHPAEQSIEALSQDVVRLIDGLGVDRIAFVGVSLGGAVGMRLALAAPDRLDRLVLACTSARFGSPDFWEERAATVRAHGVEAVANAVIERWFTPEFPDVRRYRRMLVSTPPEAYARCCEALRDWDVRGLLSPIRTPTLVVAGADDPATPLEELQAVADEIPAAKLVVLDRARHLANVERAEEFNDALLAHLAG